MTSNVNELAVSIIRTYVPIAVGAALAWLATTLGVVDLDVGAAQGLAVSIATAAYYLAARLAERRWPEAGVLLGHRTQPSYAPPD